MRAARYRLRFVPGVSLTAATYGTSTYGGPITYGQRASDPLAAYRYRVVPLPAGFPTQPAWVYRYGDLRPPLQLQILAEDSALDLTPVTGTLYGDSTYDYRTYGGGEAQLILTPVNESDQTASIVLGLLITGAAAAGVLTHNWDGDPVTDPDVPPGLYRVLVRLHFYSGRRFTLPTDDNLQLVVT
jgi:hypothetical protein